MNPYAAGAALLVVLGSYAGTFYVGSEYGRGRAERDAKQAEQLADAAAVKALQQMPDLLSNLKITNQTIYQKAIREIQTNTVYRDCRHDDGMFNALNNALAGRPGPRPGGDQPAVPAAPAAR